MTLPERNESIRGFVEDMSIAFAMWADENLGTDEEARERLAEALSDAAFGSTELVR